MSITCKGERTTHSLDYYDALALGEVDFGPPHLTLMQRVEFKIAEVARFDQSRSTLWLTWANAFFAEVSFVDSQNLPHTNDLGGKLYPENCEIKQAIVQNPSPMMHEPRYIISRDLWNQLDVDNQASMMLHEIIYRDAISRGQIDSLSVRNFLQMILIDKVSSLSLLEFEEWMTLNYLNEYQFRIKQNDSWIYVRYFDHKSFSQDQAIKYCSQLPGNSSLISEDDFIHFVIVNNSKINNALDIIRRPVWINLSSTAYAPSLKSLVTTNPASKLGFICISRFRVDRTFN